MNVLYLKYSDEDRLDLTRSGITEIPIEYKDLVDITSLQLQYNRIKSLPKWINNYRRLKSIRLSFNERVEFPPQISELNILNWICLHDCALEEIPRNIFNIKNLKYINLGNNYIKQIPDDVSKLKHLEEIILQGNHLEKISEEFFELKKLKRLNLGSSFSSELLTKLSKLTSLERLELTVPNNYKTFDFLKPLTNLKYLRIRGGINEIPESISCLNSLEELDLTDNKIQELPDWLFDLVQLKDLHFGKNNLKYISNRISELTNLWRILLYKNQISHIPDFIRYMPNLTTVCLKSNKISYLPEWLFEIQNFTSYEMIDGGYLIRTIYLNNNPILFPPIEILKKKKSIIKDYVAKNITNYEKQQSSFYSVKLETPDQLKDPIKKYLEYFKEYLFNFKGIDISFEVLDMHDCLLIKSNLDENISSEFLDQSLSKYIEYIFESEDRIRYDLEDGQKEKSFSTLKVEKLLLEIEYLKKQVILAAQSNSQLLKDNRFYKKIIEKDFKIQSQIDTINIYDGNTQIATTIINKNENKQT